MCRVLENKYNRDTDIDADIVLRSLMHSLETQERLGCISQKGIQKKNVSVIGFTIGINRTLLPYSHTRVTTK